VALSMCGAKSPIRFERSSPQRPACRCQPCQKFCGHRQGSVRQRPSFSVPRQCRGVYRPAAAALRAGAGVGWRAQLLSRGCGGL